MSVQFTRLRIWVLICACFFTFGSYFAFDQPSTISKELKAFTGINDEQYAYLYSAYSIANSISTIFGGFFIDKVGVRACSFLFSGLVNVGVLLFAIGVTIKIYGIMVLGRAIYGMGGGLITVVQQAIVAFYFKGSKHLGMSFSIILTASRLGSVLNFWISAPLTNATSVPFSVFFASILCILSLISVTLVYFMDVNYEKTSGSAATTPSKKIVFNDVLNFPLRLWILYISVALYYVSVFCFIAISTDYIQDKWTNISDVHASWISGAVYDVSLILSIPLGILVDTIGRRISLAIIGTCIAIPAHCLFAFTDVYPLVGMILLGISYSMICATVWSCASLIVRLKEVGTAISLMTAVQMLTSSIFNAIVGSVKEKTGSYATDEIIFVVVTIVTLASFIFLKFLDSKSHGEMDARNEGKSKEEEEIEDDAALLENEDEASEILGEDVELTI
ncbi:Major facilitator superfamily like protein [Aduncisulcus paluster]|uniref:Lysosomal dipeptide transporter MFSD1 n=1 Tax=Aduncisulcus paluster TaxID=2918883 RepID=A0ABQ5KM09_9EUKA|nr:Major facilitator superfamily like protein [Aduncisulcus paluster]